MFFGAKVTSSWTGCIEGGGDLHGSGRLMLSSLCDCNLLILTAESINSVRYADSLVLFDDILMISLSSICYRFLMQSSDHLLVSHQILKSSLS